MKQSAVAGILGLLAPIAYGSVAQNSYLNSLKTYSRQTSGSTPTTKTPIDSRSIARLVSRTDAKADSAVLSPADLYHTPAHYNEDDLFLSTPDAASIPSDSQSSSDIELQNLVGTDVVNLIIVDGAVPDKHLFYAMLQPGTALREIDQGSDGLFQLQLILAEYENLDTLHIVSHGDDGVLYLGNSRVDEALLRDKKQGLLALDKALADGGDLLLYGCNLASSTKGEDLVELIASEANINVAASNDLTGNAELDGDWELEIVKGEINTEAPFDAGTLVDFSAVLTTYTRTSFCSGYCGGANTYDSSDNNVTVTGDGTSINAYPLQDMIYAYKSSGNTASTITVSVKNISSFSLDSLTLRSGSGASCSSVTVTNNSAATVGTLSSPGNSADHAVTLANNTGITSFTVSVSGCTNSNSFGIKTFDITATPTDDANSTVTSSVTLTEPTTLATTIDTVGEEVGVLDFTITDLGTADGNATTITAMTVDVSGSSTDAERALLVWTLDGNDFTNESGTYNSSTDQIEFSLGTDISVADSTNETYTLRAYYNDNTSSADLSDGSTFVFSVDADTNFTVDSGGTTLASTQSAVTNSSLAIDITATTLAFTQEPSTTVTSGGNFSQQPTVAAVDARGNVDTGFSNTFSLTENGAGALSGTVTGVSPTSGSVAFSGVGYVANSDTDANFTITATTTGITDATSNSINPDVVATTLAFDTEPAPTSITSGVSVDFSTDPVVHAVDANGTLDTGYTSNVTLSIVDAGGTSLTGGHTVNSFSSTADPDSGGETDVTQAASGGIATFTGLALQYTVSGASDTIEMRATDGGASLTAVNSTTITATTNNAPAVDLNGGGAGEDNTASFTEGGGAVSIASAATVTDADADTITTITVTLTNDQDGASEGLNVTAAQQDALGGISGSSDITLQDTISITSATASVAEVQTFLRAITYNNTADSPNTTSRTITAVINDGTDNSTSRTSTISVSAVTSDTTTASGFDTTAGTGLTNSLIFDSSDETLTIGASTHTSGTANGASGTDTFVTVDTLDMSGITVSNFETITIPASTSVTMTSAQHESFTTFTNNASQSVTITSGSDNFSGDSAIESYTLGSSYSGTFTLGAATQNVTGADSAVDTVSVSTLTATGTVSGGTGEDVLQMATGSSISGATLSGFETVEVTGSVTMTEAQHDAFTTAITASGGSDQITISAATDGFIADADIETYVLGTGNTVTLGTAAGSLAQDITGSSGADTVVLGGGTYTGVINANGDTDTLSLVNSSNIAGATTSNFENLSLANDASVTIAASQLSDFDGTITAASNETINVTGDGNFSTLASSAIETYSVGDDSTNSRTITLGTGHTSGAVSATSANDAITFNIGTQSFGGSLTGNGSDDILQMGNGSSIASATLSSISSLTVDSGASVTMTEAQHDAFGSNITATGTNQITISAATDGLTGNSAIETYVLSAANDITLGAAAQNVTGSTGNDTINVSTLTATGTIDAGTGTDTLSMGNNASIAGATTSNFENLTLTSGASVTMTVTQLTDVNGGTVTASGSETINLTGNDNFSTLNNAAIENYSVGDDASDNARTITLGSNDTATNITASESSDAINFSVPGISYTGTLTGDGTTNDTITLANTANVSDGTLTGIEILSLASGAEVTLSAAQYAAISGQAITAAGSETINILGDGDITIGSTSVETYSIFDDTTNTRTVTLGSSSSNSFTASSTTDALTFDIATFDFSGSLTGNADVADTLVSDGSNDIASATITNISNLTLDGATNDLTLTAAQLNGFSGTITASGTDTLTFSATGSVTGGNLSAIETFATGTGGSITVTIPASDVSGKTLTATTSASDSFTVTGSTGAQTINGSAGGDNLSGGDGADTINPGAGNDSMTGGDGNDVFSGSQSDLNGDTITDLAAGDTVKITGVTGLNTTNVRFSNSTTLQIDTDDNTFSAVEVAITLSNSAGGDLNILAVADNGSDTDITFETTNTAPSFSNLDGTPAFTEGGSAVVLDNNVTVSDTELDALNSSAGNYSGATLTISRNGGVNSDDVFSNSGNLSSITESGSLTFNSLNYGTVTTNSGGTLLLTFSDTSNTPTTAIVSSILQAITYSNSSDTPDSSVVLDWVLNDGITNTTGTNQTTVSITATNDSPAIGTNTGITVAESGTEVINNTELNENDPDDSGTGLTYTVTTSPSHGVLQLSSVDLATDGSGTFTQDDIDNNRVQYVHAGGEDSSDSFVVSLADGGENSVSAATATVNVTVTGLNDAPSIATNSTLTVNQGSSANITNSFLNEGDPDDSGTGLTYTVTATPSNGTLTLSSVSLNASDTFTQDDIDNNRVAYNHAGGDNTSDSFNFSLADGGENGASSAVGTFNLSINDNIAPTLSSSTPSDNATSVAVGDNIVLTFSENIQLGSSGNITLINVDSSATIETFDVSTGNGGNGGTVSASGTDVTLNPGSDLPVGTNVAVRVDSTAVTDDSSNTNAYAGISDNTTLGFTTQPKVVISATPTSILEPGTESTTFTVALQNASSSNFTATDTVTVGISLSGTATVGTDYTPSSCGTGSCNLTISSGQTNTTFTAQAIDDGSGDDGETIIAEITSITTSNATEDGTQSATVTIGENTAPTVSGVPAALTITEDTQTNVVLSATVFADGEGDSLTVTFAVSSGSISSPLGSSGGVTVSNSGTTSMTLSGASSNLNTFLDNANAVAITTEANNTSDITFTITPNDGTVNGSVANSTVSVTAVNDNPEGGFESTTTFNMTGGTGAGSATFTEVESGITMTSTAIGGGTYNLSNINGFGGSTGEVILTAGGITSATNEFSSAVTVNSFQFILENTSVTGSFTFSVTSGSGSSVVINSSTITSGTDSPGITVEPTDWTNVTSFSITSTNSSFNYALDDVSVTSLGAGSDLTFIEDTQGNVDLSSFKFVDVDSSSITAILTISAGTFSTPADGAGVGSGVTETLVSDTIISLVGSPTDINTYLDTASNIQYTGAQDSSGDNAATLSISANDGDGSGSVSLQTVNIDITAVNDAPVIANLGGDSFSYTEDDAAMAIDQSSNATVTDVDNSNFNGGTLTATISNNQDTSEDILTFLTTDVTLAATTSGANVTVDSTVIGTLGSDITEGNTLTVNLNSEATVARVQTLVRNIAYQNSDTVSPAANTRTVSVTLNDGSDTSTAVTANVVVGVQNDAPFISGIPSTSVLEGALYSFTPSASDVEGDSLTFRISNAPSWASFNEVTGLLSGVPGNDDVGTTSGIVISVSDGIDSSSLAAFSITVVNTNDAPTISGTPESIVNQGTEYSFLPSASDADGDDLSFSVSNLPNWLRFDEESGELSGTPGNADVGLYSGIVLSVTDGSVSDSLPAFDVTVVNVNDAPTISGTPSISVVVDSAYIFVPTASDIDVGDELSFRITNQPDWASFDEQTGALTGTPTNEDAGSYEGIIISVTDGEETVSLDAFDIEVIRNNVAPIAVDVIVTTDEDTAVTFSFSASDEDGDNLTFSVASQPENGTVEVEGNTGTYTPVENDNGTYTFTYVANDGIEDSEPATVTVTVNPVNDAPTIEGEPATSIRVGSSYTFSPVASDIENDELTYSIANLPRWATFDPSTGTLSGAPGSDDVGTYGNIKISVSDGTDTTSLPVFNIEVLANQAPVITGAASPQAPVGEAYSFVPLASDGDQDELTFNIVNAPGWTEFNSETGALTGIPTESDIATTTGIVISVTDGIDTSSLPAFSIEVCNACDNVAPVISGIPVTTVTEGESYSFVPQATDANGDELTFAITNAPGWASFDAASGALTGVPSENDVGTTTGIVISVTDGFSEPVRLPAFSIEVLENNEAPSISGIPSISVFQNEEYRFSPTATDPNEDVLRFSVSNKPDWASFNPSTGTLRGTPVADDVGTTENIVISVSDGVNAPVSLAPFSLEVIARNSAPEISGEPRTAITQGNEYSFTPTASDIDEDELSFTIENAPDWASFDTGSGTLSGTPSAEDVGTVSGIVISVSDGTDSTSLPAFEISVTASNNAPTASNSSASVAEDASVQIFPNASDPDSDELTFTVSSGPSNGTLSEIPGGWNYEPEANFTGNDSFTYVASDGEFSSDNATIGIDVTSVNDEPQAADDSFVVDLNDSGTYVLDVLANDTDVDIDTAGDSLDIQGASANLGTVSIINNQLQFSPGNNFVGSVDLEYSIRDQAGASDFASVTVTIEGQVQVEAPTIEVPNDVTVDATGLFTRVDLGVASATDANGNPLPVSLVNAEPTFSPGTHTVFWQTEDSFGNITTEPQIVNVNPLVSLSRDQLVSEGSEVTIEVILNGDAPSYPLTVDYEVSGTALGDGTDHDAQNGSVTFNQGREQLITFNVFVDGEIEVDETIIVKLSDQINRGANSQTTITISEANIAPEIVLSVAQSGEERLTVAQDEGNVTIQATVTDANPQDSLFTEWSSDGLSNVSTEDLQFVFSPADVAAGVYQVTLFASDNGDPILSNNDDVFIEVVDTLAPLDSSLDSDGDLIPDDQEGYADSDGDGIPDYLDGIDDCNVVPEQAATQDGFLVESEPGVCLRQGSTSALNASDGLEVIVDDVAGRAVNDDGVALLTSNLPEDLSAANIGGIFDFILYDIPEEGQSVSIVIPQINPIPSNAVYRKYKETSGKWLDFVIDDNNAVFSTPGEQGICPPPGDGVWQQGLSEGDWCVQLLIQDGGPNDDDGLANGAIVDPGGVAVVLNNNRLPTANDDVAQMQWNTSINIDVLENDTDEDGDTLSITNAVSDFGNVTVNDGADITYTPNTGFVGEDSIVYAISDGNNGTGSATVTVTINGNRAPGAVDDVVTTDDLTPIEIDVLANDIDVDGDALTLQSASAEFGVATVTENNTILYTSADNFDGVDTITYVVADAFGETDTGLVQVTVDGNQAPVANDDSVITAFNTSVTIDVLANDSDQDGDSLLVTDIFVDNGTAVVNEDQTITYTPPVGFSGNDAIVYTISDGELSSEAMVSITVQPEPIETVTVTNKSSGGAMYWLLFGMIWLTLARRSQLLHDRKGA